ncbi:MAG: hypothetical protein ACRBBM_18130 [Pseudomonadaceae bacterium]
MELNQLIEALPSAATNPYAFTSYVLLVVAWVIVVFRVKRNKQLLDNLQKLPEQDRLAALKLEIHGVELKEGITPEQWIKSKIHSYLFMGFLSVCLVVTIVTVILLNQQYLNRADLEVSLYKNSTSKEEEKAPESMMDLMMLAAKESGKGKLKYPSYDFKMSFMGMITDPSFDDLKAEYTNTSSEDGLQIRPVMSYLDTINSGGELIGFRYWNKPFQWDFPRLSLKAVNNTENTIFLNKIFVTVKKSKIHLEPIPIFKENFWNVGNVEVVNEGFGNIVNPEFKFKILDAIDAESITSYDKLEFSKTFEGEYDGLDVPIMDLVSEELLEKIELPVVCVMGIMSYELPSGKRHSVKFKTRVALRMPPPGVPAPPTYEYDLFLEAGKYGYTKEIDISQAIKPSEFDHFLLKVATDKYADFDIDLKILSLSGHEFVKEDIGLTIFVPKSEASDVK